MLRSFRLANHKSIRGEQELSLLPVYPTDRSIQPVTAIYGANASGKSTVLDGLRFMRSAVLDSYARWEPGQRIPRQAFMLDPATRSEPSHYVVDLDLAGVRYTYGFSVDDRTVRQEWLYSYPEKKRRVIFERRAGDIKFGSTVPAQRGKAAVLEDLTRDNALFLSVASRVNLPETLPVYRWFSDSATFRLSGSRISAARLVDAVASLIDSSSVIYAKIVELLRFADIGIAAIEVIDQVNRPNARMHVELARAIVSLENAEKNGALDEAAVRRARVGELSESIAKMQPEFEKRLLFRHESADDVLFFLEEESDGTRAWLDILCVVLVVLDQGGLLVIDEIDTSLHPSLTARLLALFQDEETNPKLAQLICTTHDTTLLSPTMGEEVLQRSQVWFTEKNAQGETGLYPLSDFSPRKGENTERRYLGGSYGAVPRVFREEFAAAVRGAGTENPPDGDQA